MSLKQKEKDKGEHLLIEAARNLDPAEPIDSSDPRYVDCAEVRGEEGILVTKIDEAILKASKAESKPKTYLFSGHNGSGKSTELKTLEKTLVEKKLFTIKIDAQDTLDLEDPNYIDILFAIASEIEGQMRKKKMPLPKNLMNSIENWFYEVTTEKTTDKKLSAGVEAGVDASLKVPLIAKLFAKVMGQLKYSTNERKKLRRKIEPSVIQLTNFINNMVSQSEKILTKKGYLGMVIIYDNLEKMKLAYPVSNETGESRSTHEIVFIDNYHHLTGIRCHKIYTVPLSLVYSIHHTRLGQLYDDSYVLPMIKVCKTRSRNRDEKGIDTLLQVAQKRMDIDPVFESTELIKKIALFSGGNVREFIRILRYLVEPALPGDLPFTEKDIRFTFRRIIRDYETSPSDKDFELLARVYTNFSISNDRDHFRMLNNHFIFAYVDGETWYDVHPALQEISKFKAALQRLKEKEKNKKP
jgi:energy-coupling factor transporter ATP-binding protein EcfA2